jgi:hypothetical protein
MQESGNYNQQDKPSENTMQPVLSRENHFLFNQIKETNDVVKQLQEIINNSLNAPIQVPQNAHQITHNSAEVQVPQTAPTQVPQTAYQVTQNSAEVRVSQTATTQVPQTAYQVTQNSAEVQVPHTTYPQVQVPQTAYQVMQNLAEVQVPQTTYPQVQNASYQANVYQNPEQSQNHYQAENQNFPQIQPNHHIQLTPATAHQSHIQYHPAFPTVQH